MQKQLPKKVKKQIKLFDQEKKKKKIDDLEKRLLYLEKQFEDFPKYIEDLEIANKRLERLTDFFEDAIYCLKNKDEVEDESDSY